MLRHRIVYWPAVATTGAANSVGRFVLHMEEAVSFVYNSVYRYLLFFFRRRRKQKRPLTVRDNSTEVQVLGEREREWKEK